MTVDEKLQKKILKEAGKRGIEIQGVSEMGGLSFFCTKLVFCLMLDWKNLKETWII